MIKTSEIKYAEYERKSTEGEDRQILSIESQRRDNLSRITKGGLNVVAQYSEAKSAKKPGREEFNKMMSRIESGDIQGIICWALDRLARNPVDAGRIQWALQTGMLKHISVASGDHYAGDNVIVLGVHLGAANQFVIDLSKNVKRGLREKALQGWPNGVAHLGFLNEKGKGFMGMGSGSWIVSDCHWLSYCLSDFSLGIIQVRIWRVMQEKN